MPQQDYFVHLVLRHGQEVNLLANDLSGDEAEALVRTIDSELVFPHVYVMDVRITPVTEARRNARKFLEWSHDARMVEKEMRRVPKNSKKAHPFYLIGSFVKHHVDELHRLRNEAVQPPNTESPRNGNEATDVASASDRVETGGDVSQSPPRRRPAYDRDHLWLSWHQNQQLGAAAIRDKWDGLSDEERNQICPRASGKAGGPDRQSQKAGYEVVKRGLKRARLDTARSE